MRTKLQAPTDIKDEAVVRRFYQQIAILLNSMYSDDLGFVTLDNQNKDVSEIKETYIPYKALESVLSYTKDIKIIDDNNIVNKKYVTSLLNNKIEAQSLKPLESNETDLGIIVSKINEIIKAINAEN